jgi:hypothetical protein
MTDLRPPLPPHLQRLLLAAHRVQAGFPWAVRYDPSTGGDYFAVRPRQRYIHIMTDMVTAARDAFALALLARMRALPTRDRDGVVDLPPEMYPDLERARTALVYAEKSYGPPW